MTDSMQILYVEDTEADALLVASQLRRGGIVAEIRRVAGEEELLIALPEQDWSVVLGDYVLPGFDGLQALAIVRAHDPDLPFIMLSGTRGEEFAVEAMRAGAADFIPKDNLARLVPAIRRELAARAERRAHCRAEAALQRNSRELFLFHHLAEHSGEPFYILDPAASFRFIYVNPSACTHFGLSGVKLLTLQISDVDPHFPLGDMERFWERIKRQQTVLFETEHCCADGRIIPVDVSANYIVYEGQEFIAGWFRDISKRRQVEEALRASEERFRQLADAMPQLVWSAEPDGTVDYYNERREEFAGFRQRADGSWEWQPVLHPDDRQPTIDSWTTAVRTGLDYQIEHRVQRVDGSFRWYLSRGMPVRSADGTVCKWYGTATDIDDLKQAEAGRERLLAELEATIQAMANGVVIYNAEGDICHINPTAERLLEYSPELKNRPFAERLNWLAPETADGQPYPVERLPSLRALQGETVISEVIVHRPGGNEETWLSVSAAPIRTGSGRLLGAVLSLTDISDLQSLHKEREMYLHSISHDLRNPLTVVRGHAELLGFAVPVELSQLHTDEILKAAERMEAMIEDLVEAARLDGGDLRLEKKAVPLPQFIPDVLQHAFADGDYARILLDLPAGLPPVAADPNRLERILINLLSNALKYSPPTATVEVTARPGSGEVCIGVRDFGCGIDPGDIPHIFKRFHKPRGGRKAGGVGLGLYITRSLVEAHGGWIRVESLPGAGSTFHFSLPALPTAAPD